MNYGYGYNPYRQQQSGPMYAPSSSGFANMGRQGGGGLMDAYKYYQDQQQFDQTNQDITSMLADPNVSDEQINSYMSSAGSGPSFASNPRGYIINKAGEGIVEGASKVGGALKGLGSSL